MTDITKQICINLYKEIKKDLPISDCEEAQDYMDNHEWGLFTDTVLTALAEENIFVTKGAKRHIESLERTFDTNMASFKKAGTKYKIIAINTHL